MVLATVFIIMIINITTAILLYPQQRKSSNQLFAASSLSPFPLLLPRSSLSLVLIFPASLFSFLFSFFAFPFPSFSLGTVQYQPDCVYTNVSFSSLVQRTAYKPTIRASFRPNPEVSLLYGRRTTKLTDRIHPNLSSVRISTWRQAVRDKNVLAHLFREALTNPVFFLFIIFFLYFFFILPR